jgi:hypothetical protein
VVLNETLPAILGARENESLSRSITRIEESFHTYFEPAIEVKPLLRFLLTEKTVQQLPYNRELARSRFNQ